MIHKEVAVEALCALCNANVTTDKNISQSGHSGDGCDGGAAWEHLHIKNFIHSVLKGDETCPVSRSHFVQLRSILQGDGPATDSAPENHVDIERVFERNHFINEDEFFHPGFDYDFTNLKDTKNYYRGGEVYQRPCGWQRFALKVLDKYDENTWLGNRYRSTESVPGEWPVSYHGTSKAGAEGIIERSYEPGDRKMFGRGIYSTPYISVAEIYSKTFTSKKTGKMYEVILQNRINPEYREKHNNDNYWLVSIPEGTSVTEEHKMVERAIRPYGLLLREV
ncbi:uncharacterized protein LOC119893366 [Micropterus salmoides]|uniref:uncharacterized protein LOC119893366 n=1 Tax=Micropterus salmoides TaxID=27706 RepID=UPI0018EDDD69|nr:uncharacterized protein LOC119893366 [Micropterus salmoides]